ncbi:unnamed protein product [Cercospora beticola]|nr:unnamed protein product [Cercospora beticola]
MSTSHTVPRKPIGSPSSEEPAPTEAQTSLLSDEGSEDAVRNEQRLVTADKEALVAPRTLHGFPQSPGNTDKRRRSFRPISTWWQEALAIVLLLASLVASFATLYPYQDNPIPEWRYSITIGALLSLYSVILRLAATFLLSQGIAQSKWHWFNGSPKPLHDMVLHDNASRGPMGAFGLLYRLALPVTWQWLGCMLAIVALLVGPFTQQVLQYETCAVLDLEAEAVITRASAYVGQIVVLEQVDPGVWIDDGFLSFQEQASFLAGLYSPRAVPSSCSTGNCTFAPYTTVGFCSICEDLSSNVQTETIEEYAPYGATSNKTITSLGIVHEGTDFYVGGVATPYINMTLQVNYTSLDRVDRSGRPDSAFLRKDVATNFVIDDSYYVLIGLAEKPWDRNTGKAPEECTDTTNDNTWRCQGYGAAKCSISPCLRTYNSTVINGRLHEQLVGLETEALKSSDGRWFDEHAYVQAALNLSCINEDDRVLLRNRSYDLDIEGVWLPYNFTSRRQGDTRNSWDILKDKASPERGFIERGCVYVVDYDFTRYLYAWLQGQHSGSLSGLESSGDQRAMIAMNGSQLLESIWNHGDFSLERTGMLFDNMTLSSTNYMRTNPGSPWRTTHVRLNGIKPNATEEMNDDYVDAAGLYLPTFGQAWATKTCARIRWLWLILPAIVTIFTLVFYGGVLSTARALPEDVRTWKTSPLPFMFYGPGGTDESRQQEWFNASSQHVDDMDAAARKIHLKLDRDEAGMAFFRKRGAVVDAEKSSLTSGSDAVL